MLGHLHFSSYTSPILISRDILCYNSKVIYILRQETLQTAAATLEVNRH